LDAANVAMTSDIESAEVDKQHSEHRIVTETLLDRRQQHLVTQSHRLCCENAPVHQQRRVYNWLKIHVRKNISVDINARRDFDEFQAVLGQLKHAALGDIEHGLSPLQSIVA